MMLHLPKPICGELVLWKHAAGCPAPAITTAPPLFARLPTNVVCLMSTTPAVQTPGEGSITGSLLMLMAPPAPRPAQALRPSDLQPKCL